jgi:L-glyceraldehyde 3-phosphate reductase
LTEDVIKRLNGLNDIAAARGQTLAQMAIAWVLRGGRVTTALIGASRVSQIEDCVGALENGAFSEAELAAIEELSLEGNLINLWARSSEEV